MKPTPAPFLLILQFLHARFLAGTSGRNHQVDRLGAFALLVRFDLECNALSFVQILQSGPLHRGDVNEHIAAAVIGLDEAIATFSVEELDRTSHGHRETPPPYCSAATQTLRIGPTGVSAAEELGHPERIRGERGRSV